MFLVRRTKKFVRRNYGLEAEACGGGGSRGAWLQPKAAPGAVPKMKIGSNRRIRSAKVAQSGMRHAAGQRRKPTAVQSTPSFRWQPMTVLEMATAECPMPGISFVFTRSAFRQLPEW